VDKEAKSYEDSKPEQRSESRTAPPALRRGRRREIREGVENTATILLVKVGSTLRGRILDLSLGGCRISTEARFPVGIYTRVETEFHLEGLPFRLGGVIQAIHDRNTVGIRFLDLSERKRQQVLELIEEIQQIHARTLPVDPIAVPSGIEGADQASHSDQAF
jgi:c-di-GMP-binding flagellar brake protein YcgR